MGTGTAKKAVFKKELISLGDSLERAREIELAERSEDKEERKSRVEKLRKEVQGGTYRVDSTAVARAMLKHTL